MNIKKIFVFILVLVVIVFGVLLISRKNSKNKTLEPFVNPTPSIEEQLKNKFNGMVIPSDSERIELNNVSGGEGMGIATKNEIIADLPDLNKGEAYQVLLSNGTKTVLLGTMQALKGGFILEYKSSKYSGYNKVLVVKGTKTILEGSF